MTWEQYAAAWSALHGGFDPRTASPVVRGWVRLAYRGGRLLASLRVGPTAVTVAGLLLCAGVPFVPPLAGAMLVLLAGIADTLDGAVAVVAGRATRLGFVYDSVADRLGELAWLGAFWVAGAPGWLVVTGLAVSWLHEYVRARAAAGGMDGVGVVTMGERPTRVSVAAVGLAVVGIAGLVQPGWDRPAAVVAVTVWSVLSLIGLGQLLAAVRRALID
ncbi:CDP-diacylglycerol--glycerol-3-phosphate 3-phosphatidyltransferase [Couchioplanes caeruleus]|uniref:CDP-diacylglycerol--glycerol-3-phosphate 3-phosphatidyltransferase n=1 Tax=Couchioplanes caeruleus TaxID=56438 RepID=A0A3N1GGJ7_9ACTN|nr:CDP-alcohol phosphatidyltransferase family protein [Couchioplanes caeruleus]ROP29246.1 CDP-diacylglycerol--glycerol-3-phosphate 3-phosphatidyltransferase [Couchioplanes caeruleus]